MITVESVECAQSSAIVFQRSLFFLNGDGCRFRAWEVLSEISGREKEPSESIVFEFSTLTAVEKTKGAEKRSPHPWVKSTLFNTVVVCWLLIGTWYGSMINRAVSWIGVTAINSYAWIVRGLYTRLCGADRRIFGAGSVYLLISTANRSLRWAVLIRTEYGM